MSNPFLEFVPDDIAVPPSPTADVPAGNPFLEHTPEDIGVEQENIIRDPYPVDEFGLQANPRRSHWDNNDFMQQVLESIKTEKNYQLGVSKLAALTGTPTHMIEKHWNELRRATEATTDPDQFRKDYMWLNNMILRNPWMADYVLRKKEVTDEARSLQYVLEEGHIFDVANFDNYVTLLFGGPIVAGLRAEFWAPEDSISKLIEDTQAFAADESPVIETPRILSHTYGEKGFYAPAKYVEQFSRGAVSTAKLAWYGNLAQGIDEDLFLKEQELAHREGLFDFNDLPGAPEVSDTEVSELRREVQELRAQKFVIDKEILDLEPETRQVYHGVGPIQGAFLEAMSSAPSTVSGLASSGVGMLAGGGIGFVLGGPEGAALGARIGGLGLGFLSATYLERGTNWVELRNTMGDDGKPIDVPTLSAWNNVASVAKGLIEVGADAKFLMPTLGPAGDFLLKGQRSAAAKAAFAQRGFRESLKDLGKRWLTGAGGEGLEEFTQAGVDILAKWAAESQHNQRFMPIDTRAALDQMVHAGIIGALAGGMAGSIATPVHVATQLIERGKIRRAGALAESIERLAGVEGVAEAPVEFNEMIHKMAKDLGRPIEGIFMSPIKLQEMAAKHDVSIKEVVGKLLGPEGQTIFDEALQQAQAAPEGTTKATLRIEVEDFFKNWSSLKLLEGFAGDITTASGTLTMREDLQRQQTERTELRKTLSELKKLDEENGGWVSQTAAEQELHDAVDLSLRVAASETKALTEEQIDNVVRVRRTLARVMSARSGLSEEDILHHFAMKFMSAPAGANPVQLEKRIADMESTVAELEGVQGRESQLTLAKNELDQLKLRRAAMEAQETAEIVADSVSNDTLVEAALDNDAMELVERVSDGIINQESEGPDVNDEIVPPQTLEQMHNLQQWETRVRAWMKHNGYTKGQIEKHIQAMRGQMAIFTSLSEVEYTFLPRTIEGPKTRWSPEFISVYDAHGGDLEAVAATIAATENKELQKNLQDNLKKAREDKGRTVERPPELDRIFNETNGDPEEMASRIKEEPDDALRKKMTNAFNEATKKQRGTKNPFGPIRKNSDAIYKLSFDLSAMCKKRLEAAATIKLVEQRLNEKRAAKGLEPRSLDISERLALASLFRLAGKEAPCLYCYVESPRQKVADHVNVGISTAVGEMAIPDRWSDTLKGLAQEAANELEEQGISREDLPSPTYWTDPDTMQNEAVRAEWIKLPRLYRYMQAQVTAAKANAPKQYSEYWGQILSLSEDFIRDMDRYAGFRFFSTSDFQFEHIADMMQAFHDMALRKVRSHAYTKVEEYVDIFGDTGQKIQTSMFATVPVVMREVGENKWEALKRGGDGKATDEVLFTGTREQVLAEIDEYTPDSGFVEDTWQGMSWDKAAKFREKHANVGNVFIATSSAQIRWALDQDGTDGKRNIDYIIPFHASGMQKDFFESLGYVNFTSTQEEKWSDPKAHKGQEVKKIRMHELGALGGISNEELTKNYLRLCEERGLTPAFAKFQSHPRFGILKKDYARSDTPFEPVKTHHEDGSSAINMKAVENVLSQFLEFKHEPASRPDFPTAVPSEPIAKQLLDMAVSHDEGGVDPYTAAQAKLNNVPFSIGKKMQQIATEAAAEIGVVEDVLEQQAPSESRILPSGLFNDENTGLLNERGLASAPKDPKRPFMAVFSLEGKKLVNDEFGHDVGDAMLRIAAGPLRAAIPDGAKIGGDLAGRVAGRAQLDQIVGEMQKAIGPEFKVTAGMARETDNLRDSLDAAFAEDKKVKGAAFKAGELGFRGGIPASLLKKGAPKIAYEEGMEGLPLKSKEAQAALKKAVAELAPAAKRLEQAGPATDIPLSMEHQEIFSRMTDEEVDRTIHIEPESGLLTEAGWKRARKTKQKGYAVSADARAIKEMDKTFGRDATDEIIRAVSSTLAQYGGEDFDAAHPHGDEFFAQSDNAADLEGFFKTVQEKLSKLVFIKSGPKGSVIIQKGVDFDYGLDKDLKVADKEKLPAAKAARKEVAKPEVLDGSAASRRLAELRGQRDLKLIRVDNLVRERSERRAREAAQDQAQRLEQPGKATSRGYIKIAKKGFQKIFKIFLKPNADISTPLHEMAHAYFTMLHDIVTLEGPVIEQRELRGKPVYEIRDTFTGKALASFKSGDEAQTYMEQYGPNLKPKVPKSIQHDYGAILSWLGVGSWEEVTREKQEMFAKGFEKYLLEGKAPSVSLINTFARIGAYLFKIYRGGLDLEVEIDDTLRGVFDRMLATDDEINLMRKAMGIDLPFYATAKQAGMTKKQFAEYTKKREENVNRGALHAYALAMEAQHKALTKEWRNALAENKKLATEEYDKRLDVRAEKFIRKGQMTNEDGSDWNIPLEFSGKLNREAVQNMVGKNSPVEQSVRAATVKEAGYNPDEVALMFGYKTGAEMLQAIASLGPRAQAIREIAEQMTLKENPELKKRIDSLDETVGKALHDVGTTDALLREWRMLNTQIGRGATQQLALEQYAQRLVAETKTSELRPADALAKELRYAEESMAAAARGDIKKAADLKLQQLINHFKYRALLETKTELAKGVRFMKGLTKDSARSKLGKAGARVGDDPRSAYLDVADTVLEGMGLANKRPQELPRLGIDSLISQLETDSGTVTFEPLDVEKLLAKPKPLKQLTVEEFRTLHNLLSNIVANARKMNKVKRKEQELDVEEGVRLLIEEGEEHLPTLGLLESSTDAASQIEKLVRGGRGWSAVLLRQSTMINWLGGRDVRSAWHQLVLTPLRWAEKVKAELMRDTIKPIVETFEDIPRAIRWRLNEKIDGNALFPNHQAGLLKAPTRRFELLIMALNIGTQGSLKKDGTRDGTGNFERLTKGRNITEAEVMAALGKLTLAEWKWVQSVWDANEKLWPLSRDLEMRDSGLAPKKLPLRPFTITTSDGHEFTSPGGYVPAVYDRRGASHVQATLGKNIGDVATQQTFVRPGTSRGHLKGRAQDFADVITLSPEMFKRGLAQTAHDIAFREPVRQVARLVLDEDVQKLLKDKLGPERANTFVDWLRAEGGNTMEGGLLPPEGLHRLRSNAMTAILGWRIKTMLGDIAGAFVAAPKLKSYWATGWAQYYQDPAMWKERVSKYSTWIPSAQTELEQAYNSITSKMTTKGNPFSQAARAYKETAWWGFDQLFKFTAYPMWTGAFQMYMAENKMSPEDAAIAADNLCMKYYPSHTTTEKSAIQRDTKSFLGFSMIFFGYMNSVYQVNADAVQEVKDVWFQTKAHHGQKVWNTAKALPAIVGTHIAFLSASMVLGELFTGRGPSDEEEKEGLLGWTKWYGRKLLAGLLGPIPLIGHSLEAWIGGGRVSERGAPGISALIDGLNVIANSGKLWDGDIDAIFKALRTLAMIYGIPMSPLEQVEYFLRDEGLKRDLRQGDVPGMVEGTLYGRHKKWSPANIPSLAAKP